MSHTIDARGRASHRSMHVQSSRRGGSTAALLCGAALSACVLACSGDGAGEADAAGPLDVTVTPIQPRPPVQAAPAENEPGNAGAADDEREDPAAAAQGSADESPGSAGGNAEPAPDDGSTGADTTDDATLDFATDVWPIFNGNCGPCHESLRQGGHNVGSDDVEISFEAAVQNERLILSDLAAGAMPPGCSARADGEGCVPDADIDIIRAWYAAGSPR